MEENMTETTQAAEAAASEAPAAGAAEQVQEAVEQVAEAAASTDPNLEAKLKETSAKLKEALAALKSRNEADAAALAAEEKSLLDELSEGDPVRWGAIYAKMKKAGKIGSPDKSASSAPAADRSRISADAGKDAAPASVEQARAATMAELERM
jgi:hypothetical protein